MSILLLFEDTSSSDSYHLYHPTFRNPSIIPTLNPSNLDPLISLQRLKVLPPTSGHLHLASLILIIVHHPKLLNRLMSFLVFLLLRAIRSVSTSGRSWREINWKFR